MKTTWNTLILALIMVLTFLNCFSQAENDPQEFMLFVYKNGDHVTDLSADQQQAHIQKIGAYIGSLAKSSTLKGANPLVMEGIKISNPKATFTTTPLSNAQQMTAGYYHIIASDLEEAKTIAMKDPRFEEKGWEIVIRPIKKVTGIN